MERVTNKDAEPNVVNRVLCMWLGKSQCIIRLHATYLNYVELRENGSLYIGTNLVYYNYV